jgi:hypothetical protein
VYLKVNEHTVDLEIEETYSKLKATLVEKGCKIVSEEPPKQISVKQGSLWGVTPRSAKKTVQYHLEPIGQKTRVTFSSKLSTDWKNLTIIGTALSFIVVGLCLWISMDLSAFTVTRQSSYWSWIATVNGYVDFRISEVFINLTRALAVFLSVIIALEVVIAVYAYFKINFFGEETLPK